MSPIGSLEVVLDEDGLVPAICQDVSSGSVLMLAYMNAESLNRTLATGEIVFYSRSRKALWQKGATSGNYLHVESAHVDCDGDALLFRVHADGPACHTGEVSCFFRPIPKVSNYVNPRPGPEVLGEVYQIIRERQVALPTGSYTASLFTSGIARIAQKVAEEASEVAIAAASGDITNIPAEVADLLYHTLVLLAKTETSPQQVWDELRSRRHG